MHSLHIELSLLLYIVRKVCKLQRIWQFEIKTSYTILNNVDISRFKQFYKAKSRERISDCFTQEASDPYIRIGMLHQLHQTDEVDSLFKLVNAGLVVIRSNCTK